MSTLIPDLCPDHNHGIASATASIREAAARYYGAQIARDPRLAHWSADLQNAVRQTIVREVQLAIDSAWRENQARAESVAQAAVMMAFAQESAA